MGSNAHNPLLLLGVLLWPKRPMDEEFKMKINKQLKKTKKSFFAFSKLAFKPLKRPIRRTLKYAEMDLIEVLHLLIKLSKRQSKKRPRIKVVASAIIMLAVFYLASGKAVAYIKPKEAEIKIGGQAVLVADKTEPQKPAPAEVDQAIVPKLSPFKFREPVSDGLLTQGYSSYHMANDIAAPYNSPIHPLGPGTVVFAGFMADGHGNTVVVDHGNGLETLYAHMNMIDVAVGNQITEDTQIGTIGLTGHTTGPHVHIEVINDGVQIDPASVLPD